APEARWADPLRGRPIRGPVPLSVRRTWRRTTLGWPARNGRARTPRRPGYCRRQGYGRGMDIVRWEQRPQLRRPVMLAAFEGWNDAGEAASTAARYMATACNARQFASIDPEDFYDFTATRPQVRLVEGQ